MVNLLQEMTERVRSIKYCACGTATKLGKLVCTDCVPKQPYIQTLKRRIQLRERAAQEGRVSPLLAKDVLAIMFEAHLNGREAISAQLIRRRMEAINCAKYSNAHILALMNYLVENKKVTLQKSRPGIRAMFRSTDPNLALI